MRYIQAALHTGILCVTLISASSEAVSASSIECGAIVGTIGQTEIKSKLMSSSHVPTAAAGLSMYLIQNDVQARKICASCQDAQMVNYAKSFVSANNKSTWEEFCGDSAYGSDATVSGLMLIPVDSDGNVIEGPLAGHINGHQALTETYNQIPSETFEHFDKHWLSIVAASSGKIAIEPDYLGYGESSDYFKSFLIRPAYATATVPLWQYAVETIAAESDCRSYLKPVAYVAGYGEGAFAALSIAEALHSTWNVEIVKASLGGGPYRLGSLALPRLVDNINEKVMTSEHYYLLALIGSSYSSTNSWLPNFGTNQDLLDPQYRDPIVQLVQDGGSLESFLETLPPRVTDAINTDFFVWMKNMAVQGEYMGCLAGPPTESDFNGHFCSALLENDLTNVLNDATYDIDLCHSPDDEVFHIDNLPPELSGTNTFTFNTKLSRQLASGSHDAAYRFCSQLAVTEGLFTNPRLSPITECAPRQTVRPTLEPIPTRPPPTPAPTPKPSTRIVESNIPSSANRLGRGYILVLLGMSTGALFW